MNDDQKFTQFLCFSFLSFAVVALVLFGVFGVEQGGLILCGFVVVVVLAPALAFLLGGVIYNAFLFVKGWFK